MSKQGGSITSDFAKDGTSVPSDAGKQNIIPSVPNPHQKEAAAGGLGSVDTPGAADNATDMPAPGDKGSGTGEVLSASGHSLPASTGQKPSGSGGK